VKTQRLDSPLFRGIARELLGAGHSVRFQASGFSMLPQIQDGELVHVAPVRVDELRCGDIVLVEQGAKLRAHRLIGKDAGGDQFVTQGDASLEPDSPVRASQILGRVVAKEVVAKERIAREVMAKDQIMNGIGGRVARLAEVQRVELHGVRAQARRRMTHVRNVAAGWVKSALGMRVPGSRTNARTNTRTGAALAFLLCLAAVSATAQVAVDSNGFSGATTTTGSNFTFNHNAGAGSNLLVVGVAMNIAAVPAAKVATITYGAQALTFLNSHNDAGNTRRVEIWFLRAPVLGLHVITVTMSAFGAGNVGTFGDSVTFTGADQTDPFRPFVSADGVAAVPYHSVLDIPSAPKEFVYAVEAIGGDFDQASPAAFTTVVQQGTGFTGTGTVNDVTGAGYTSAGAPSVPIPVVLTATRAATTPNWAMGGLSIHPLNADMGVTVTTNGAIVAGGTTTYTVKLQDNGGSDAANVVLTFPLAAGETFVSATPSQGSACTFTAPTVTCNLGTVPSAFSATVTIKATIATAGNYTTTATVASTTTDLYTGNNTFTVTVPVQSVVCATPGNDGTPGAPITGVVNTYYPGTASVASGATSLTLGTPTGSATAIANGDLLLVMQMQDAAINTTNGSTYGDGSGSGSGSTSLNAAGAYEYVRATGFVIPILNTLSIAGTGPGGGLIYSYTNAAATTTQGQRRFQVIRVPQYVAATLGAALTASAWNGTTGGVLALDVQNTLTLAGQTVSVDGLGFRGGAGLQLDGVTAGSANTDFRFAAPAAYPGGGPTNGWHGIKGEGIAGTPAYVESGGTFLASGSNYPSGAAADGSMGRGAPGNAGGGGTDAESVAANSNNSGGSGGGNGGIGGAGGNSQGVDLASGGVPAASFPNSINRVVMGGGGGAGGRNNVTTATASAGGAGGGIVMIRAGFLSGTATISANGLNPGDLTPNEGGGGGGAGGAVMVLSEAGGENGLTIKANGGKGGDANDLVAFATFTAGVHGPGGGGGGGFIATTNVTGSPATSKTGGLNGTTETTAFEWGATAGAAGPTPINSAKLSQVAGVRSGVECVAPDCVINKTHVGNFVRGTAGNNYTITVSNASPAAAIVAGNTVTVVDTLPAGLTATAISGTGWTCTLATLTCTRADALLPLASYPAITLTVTVAAAPPSNTLVNTAVVSGGGEVQVNNDTATDSTTIIGTVLTIAKSGAPNPIRPGQTLTYTINVANNGPNAEATATVTDPLPTTDVSFVSAVATNGWGCAQAAGTVTCTRSPFAIGGTSVITITTTTLIPDKVVNTATITDTDTGLDTQSSTATTITTFPTSVAVRSFSAQRVGSGTVLNWQTGGEHHNLGFNVYREENGARVKVNPSLIAGSALRMRESLDQHNGTSYAWPDAKTGTAYWLEDVEINGARTMHGPVYPEAGKLTQASQARAATMAELSRASAQAQAASAPNSSAATTGPVFDTSRAVPHFVPVQAVTQQQRQTQFELAAHPAVKLSLRNEGWYRISQPELVVAGLNAAVDPKFLRLFTEGIEQPIRITGVTGGPGGFGTNAAIEFYATGIDTPFSDTRVGWLVAGNRPGLRIAEAGNSGGNAAPLSFPYAVELRQRTTYFAALLNGENNDNFFGAVVTATLPADQVLATQDVDASGAVQLEVALQGATTNITHSVNVNLNGTFVGALNFADQQLGKALLNVPAGQLLEGNNTVTLTAQNGDNDVSLVDHITLHYFHTYVAESDALRFTAPAGGHVQITGFGTKPVRLVDITNPARPVNLQAKVTGTVGQYALDVNVPWASSGTASTGTHTLLSLAWSRLAHAPSAKNQPSSWHTPQPGSDIVMITHPSFTKALQPLVELRRSQGKSVSVVSVDDLYDEFNFGERSPHALRDFLASATGNWKTHPHYLLLVGDATFDPRNYLGFGYDDFVPTRIVETFFLKTASDEWFSDFNNTGLGEIAIGRLPVRTIADAQTAVRKIVEHDQAAGAWSTQALLVADVDGGLTFSTDTQDVKSLLPSTLTANVADANQIGIPATHAQILAQINSGALLVNYMGHGSVEVWGNGDLLKDADAATFTNGNRLPVFVIMDCLNGFFHDVYTTSMAESLLLAPNGGAVAVWSSSGLNDSAPQAELDKQLVRAMFSTQNPALGDAIRAAKSKVDVLDVRRTYILFGDPSMRLQK
jgi:uncharacterized repeat protein (TIGR01451 family)